MNDMTARALTIALLLVVAPAAQAKELASITVCGASDCVRVTPKDIPNKKLHLLVESVGEADPPAAPAPWYLVKVRGKGDGETFSWTQAYVPSEGLVRGLEDASHPWSAILPDAKPLFDRLTRGLKPRPARTLGGLDVRPPEARVDEVFAPAPAPSTVQAGTEWPWLAGAAAAAILAAAALVRRRRHPSV